MAPRLKKFRNRILNLSILLTRLGSQMFQWFLPNMSATSNIIDIISSKRLKIKPRSPKLSIGIIRSSSSAASKSAIMKKSYLIFYNIKPKMSEGICEFLLFWVIFRDYIIVSDLCRSCHREKVFKDFRKFISLERHIRIYIWSA